MATLDYICLTIFSLILTMKGKHQKTHTRDWCNYYDFSPLTNLTHSAANPTAELVWGLWLMLCIHNNFISTLYIKYLISTSLWVKLFT